MRSIINHLKQSRDFPRLRIGIGRPTGKLDAIGFVLRSFTKEEQEEVCICLQNFYAWTFMCVLSYDHFS
jgi:PTH1 family peptidyl-tRNA hydrolase